MGEHDFASPSVRDFLGTLASDRPTPGGGSGAAVVGAMGAALVEMLARLTLGRPKFASAAKLMEAVAEGAREAGGRLVALAADDAAAYDHVSAAMKLPKGTDAEKAARTEALQTALRGACEVPLQVMEACTEVIGLAKNAVEQGNPNAVSDGAAGAELARAALKVASYNVRINLTAIQDETYRKDARTRMDEMLYMGTSVATVIDSKVSDLWK
jgi:methenyltetrahydrofolate cyclohydrolase